MPLQPSQNQKNASLKAPEPKQSADLVLRLAIPRRRLTPRSPIPLKGTTRGGIHE
jgi:hypothetical protein